MYCLESEWLSWPWISPSSFWKTHCAQTRLRYCQIKQLIESAYKSKWTTYTNYTYIQGHVGTDREVHTCISSSAIFCLSSAIAAMLSASLSRTAMTSSLLYRCEGRGMEDGKIREKINILEYNEYCLWLYTIFSWWTLMIVINSVSPLYLIQDLFCCICACFWILTPELIVKLPISHLFYIYKIHLVITFMDYAFLHCSSVSPSC